MKIAFIHLSDLHIDSRKDYDKLDFQSKLQFLNNDVFKDVDAYNLILTGDLVGKASHENYSLVTKILNSIKKEIQEKYNKIIKVIAVPGNHDMKYATDEIASKSDTVNKIDYDIELKYELDRLNDYRNFCNANSIPYVELVKNHIVNYSNDFSIEYVLMNSAVFTRFKHTDYGKHYLPPEELHRIGKPTIADVKIGLIHHTLPWFEPESKMALTNLIRDNVQILFLGHEHDFCISQNTVDENNFEITNVNGGALYERNSSQSIFNICVLDSKKSIFTIYKANGILGKKPYNISEISSTPVNLSKGNKKFKLNKEVEHELFYLADKRDMDTFYVFPDLKYQIKDDDKYVDKEMNDLDGFLKTIDDKKIIEINGKNHIGKTSLVRKLFSFYYKHTLELPLILDVLDYQGKYEKWEKDAFEYYYDKEKYIEFTNLDSSEKVLFIDNFHLLKKEKTVCSFIRHCLTKYSKIILVQNKKQNEEFGEEINSLLEDDAERIKFDFLNLKPKKRKNLIYKVCCSDKSYASTNEIYLDVNEIESFLRAQPSFIKYDPNLVMRLTSMYINSSDQSKINVFHDVFVGSLSEAIKNGFDDDSPLGEILIAKVAYKIYKMKEYPFKRSIIEEVIDEYVEEYGGKLDYDEIYNNIIKTGIIKKTVDNKLIFESNNHLSYFIAKEIQRKRSEDGDNTDHDMLINDVSNGINGDIMLYLSLVENSIELGKIIVKKSKENLNDVIEISLNDLYKSSGKYSIKAIENEETKEKRYEKEEKKNEKEEEKEYFELEKVNFFDSDKRTAKEKKREDAATYLELNCKLFSSFYRRIKKDFKREIVQELYSQSNKFLYLIITPFVNDFPKLQQSFVDFFSETEEVKKRKLRDDDLKNIFEQFFITLEYNTILQIYNLTSIFSVCRQNVDELIGYDCSSNDLSKILNLLFIQRKNNKSLFYDCLKKEYHSTKNIVIKNLIIKIFNHYIITNRIFGPDEQSVASALNIEKSIQSIKQEIYKSKESIED